MVVTVKSTALIAAVSCNMEGGQHFGSKSKHNLLVLSL
jgi:hypothetical protein